MERIYRKLDAYISAPKEALPALTDAIWEEFGATMAPLVLDMSGFSRLTKAHGIVHYLAMVRRMHLASEPLVEAHRGHVVKFEADNLFAVFYSADDALACALAINDRLAEMNAETEDSRDIAVCIGIDWGRLLLVPWKDFFGDTVNIACKLGEDLAGPGEILISRTAAETLTRTEGLRLEPRDLAISDLRIAAFQVSRA
ncbi:MAG TPA: adenylate/guanylate cyclase domain-containing protein [Alphaproteobacteria bacterium]|nr:adenylate/guanylate cyclase domain-containing protein [Alphaproteobacteria bacterium]